MTRLTWCVGMLTVLLLSVSGALYPCGGPDTYPIAAPLLSGRAYLENLLEADYLTDRRRPEIRFLYPIKVARPEAIATLWDLAYGADSGQRAGAPLSSTGPAGQRLEAAIAKGDLAAGVAEAKGIVNQVLDMPAIQADSNQRALRLAVEFLELHDTLSHVPPAAVQRTLEELRAPIQSLTRAEMSRFVEAHPSYPRAASLRFVGLQEAMKTDIPNGWRQEIQKQMSPGAWARLEQLHDQWLKDYPDHPLADLVVLSKARVYYLKGEDASAWALLLRVYARHPVRALAEMRYMILTGAANGIDSLALHSTLDPALRTALLGEIQASQVTPADWTAMWQLSVEHDQAPWAESLQERLLQKAAEWSDSAPLPAGFPSQAANPSDHLRTQTLWGYFRALALLRVGSVDRALEQTRAPGTPVEVAPLRVKLLLRRHEWTTALSDPALESHTRQYLIWVMAPDSTLASLASGSSEIAKEARLARAVHVARRDGWLAGTQLITTSHPGTAALWRRAAALAADSSLSGRLAYARFLRDRADQLYFSLSQSHTWHRSLEYRRGSLQQPDHAAYSDPGLPWSPDEERAAIERHYLETSATFQALHLYADYLDRAPATSAGFFEVLGEADHLYNLMVNWDQTSPGFWKALIPTSPEAQAIRRAGRRARTP